MSAEAVPVTSMPVRMAMSVAGGLIAGVAFIALNSWFATSTGMDPFAPFKMIATLAQGPPPESGTVWIGMAIHLVLSILFGILFAAITQGWAGGRTVAALGLLYGGVLYVINFQVLSRFVEYWSAFHTSANQPFELAAHLVFGAVLALFLIPFGRYLQPRTNAE
ncbi:hypothetical protein [Saccharopolyspora elongata]|uniref:DUF1440 domain-containing protein n=1 Tax=Saccharopolyspora elongata TaxID=2530387 RepID=A0A4V2YNQ4_9PSEU|nr:hypothetical protein [Saccharopolyspora elongata]TDD55227.1 hypothetical protein E1288_05350 [Saccharopolyspora elongata]